MHATIAYILIFLGVIIEGEIVVILAGIFSHLGSLNIMVAWCMAMLGGISKSFLGYSLGYYLEKNYSGKTFVKNMERRIAYFLPHFNERPFWSIFVSNFFILGMSWFTKIFSGYKKIKWKEYLKADISALFVWATFVLSLGYFFSYEALSISRDVRKFIGLIFLFFIAFFLLEKIVAFILEIAGNSFNYVENKDNKK